MALITYPLTSRSYPASDLEPSHLTCARSHENTRWVYPAGSAGEASQAVTPTRARTHCSLREPKARNTSCGKYLTRPGLSDDGCGHVAPGRGYLSLNIPRSR